MTLLSFLSFLLLMALAMGQGLLRTSHSLDEGEHTHSILLETELIEEEEKEHAAVDVLRNEYGYRLLGPPHPHRDLQGRGTPSDPNYNGCGSGWKRKQNIFRRNRQQVWTNPTCYSFVLTPICYCVPDDRRPLRIRVKNDTVTKVSFVDDPSARVPDSVPRPTMNALFARMKANCFTGCPNKGAEECSASYDGVNGNFKRLYINPSLLYADDEMVRVCRVVVYSLLCCSFKKLESFVDRISHMLHTFFRVSYRSLQQEYIISDFKLCPSPP
jgi:hypothetical protein